MEASAPRTRKLVLGIGDDAAAWRPSRSNVSVITSDALVDGVHFRAERMSFEDVGRRALATNLSDIAAMGARPVLATVALGLPATLEGENVLAIYRGMASLAEGARVAIAGGDVVRTPVLTLSLTVVGEVRPSNLKRRDGGRAGDVLAVTGPLGAARAGLELLDRELPVEANVAEHARAAFARPEPRLREGRWLAASANVHAMMDISDALSTDAIRLAKASRCGVRIDEVPIHPAAQAVATAAGHEARKYALDGGDDYELLVAVAPRAFLHLSRRFEQRFGKPLLRCGALTANENTAAIVCDGVERELRSGGWDSLARSESVPGP